MRVESPGLELVSALDVIVAKAEAWTLDSYQETIDASYDERCLSWFTNAYQSLAMELRRAAQVSAV